VCPSSPRLATPAGQSGHRLAEERQRQGLTQAQLAQAMRSSGSVSPIERGEQLDGHRELLATFTNVFAVQAT
jgi:transcriptional regulator with XRE-family HTH domain